MGILQITPDEVGQVAQLPRTVKIITTDGLSTVTAAGYLNPQTLLSNIIYPSDVINIIYSWTDSTQNGTFGIFRPSFSGSTITLSLYVDAGNVLLPVVSNDFAVFNGTTGQIKDAGYLPSDASKTKVVMAGSAVQTTYIAKFVDTTGTVDDTAGAALNAGNIQAGLSGTAGTMISYPATASSGSMIIAAVANVGNFNSTLSSVTGLGQASVYTLPDPANALARVIVGATATPFTSGNLLSASGTGGLVVDSAVVANRVLFTTFSSPDAAADLVAFDVTVGQAALAAGGAVALITSSGSKQYKIRSLQLNSGGTNFSGGGGDRLGQVTDGTTVFSVVPAATMQSLANAQWGVTALPNPASAAINTSTVAGANLSFKYSGGAADYTAGSLVITGVAQRVA